MAYKDKEREKEYQREYYLKNKNKLLIQNKKYYLENKEKILKCNKNYYLENKDKIEKYRLEHKEKNKEYQKVYILENKDKIAEYRSKNRDKILEIQKNWRIKNKEEIRKYDRKWRGERYISDIGFKLRSVLRSSVRDIIKRNQKSGSAIRDLGCSIDELKFYIEGQFQQGMTWDNWGVIGTGKKWNIDHKIPLAFFDLTDRKQFLVACHYTNLQPLWALENIRKSNKILI